MTRDEILNALDAAGLEHRRDEAVALLQPALRLTAAMSQDKILPVGASKMGGEPDLPATAEWPHWTGQRQDRYSAPHPLHFLAQINFADTHPIMNSALPSSGLLSIFYDAEFQPDGGEDVDLPGFRVLYTPANTTLERRSAPAPLSVVRGVPALFSPCAIGCSVTVPMRSLWQMCSLTNAEEDILENLLEQCGEPVPGYGKAHQLLGLADYIQGEEVPYIALKSLGLDYKALQDASVHSRVEEEARQWQLLLQIDSDDTPGWGWGDGGMLYFHIRKSDLAALNFDHVQMTQNAPDKSKR